MSNFTNAVQAAAFLRDCASTDPELRYSLALIAHNNGAQDFLAWAADADPDIVIAIADTQYDIMEQEGLISKGMQSA